MPLYDYRCETCEKVSEIRHGFDEQAGPCAHCGGHLVRQFHAAPIVFKGSGFYVTDSRSSSSPSSTTSEKPAETKPTSTDTSSSTTPPSSGPSPKGEAAA